MQVRTHCEDGQFYECNIPDEDSEVMSGVHWGSASTPFTPAYWRLVCITNGSTLDKDRYRLGSTLQEEVVACLLGGHGVTGELGVAAYNHLRLNHVVENPPSVAQIEKLLVEPLIVNGNPVRYRFPRQKAKYIALALDYLDANSPPEDCGKALRDWLTAVPGIGYKTASWITRNWLDSQEIAILDIHIHRAGVLANIFTPHDDVTKNYLQMEEKFVGLANNIGIPANVLDNQIWNGLRLTPRLVRQMLMDRGVTSKDQCGLPPANNRSTSRNYGIFTAT